LKFSFCKETSETEKKRKTANNGKTTKTHKKDSKHQKEQETKPLNKKEISSTKSGKQHKIFFK
jgi:ureidoglycolate hydrolase